MQTQQPVLCPACQEREQNEELVGVLTAISIVSKRLAARLAVMERRRAEKSEGGIHDE